MTKSKKEKRPTMIYKTLHRKLYIKLGMGSGSPEESVLPGSLVTPLVMLMFKICP